MAFDLDPKLETMWIWMFVGARAPHCIDQNRISLRSDDFFNIFCPFAVIMRSLYTDWVQQPARLFSKIFSIHCRFVFFPVGLVVVILSIAQPVSNMVRTDRLFKMSGRVTIIFGWFSVTITFLSLSGEFSTMAADRNKRQDKNKSTNCDHRMMRFAHVQISH